MFCDNDNTKECSVCHSGENGSHSHITLILLLRYNDIGLYSPADWILVLVFRKQGIFLKREIGVYLRKNIKICEHKYAKPREGPIFNSKSNTEFKPIEWILLPFNFASITAFDNLTVILFSIVAWSQSICHVELLFTTESCF